jgi:EpsI family protein
LFSQAALLYSFSRREPIPVTRPLNEFPPVVGDWTKLQDGVVDKETLDVLQADDVLSREYVRHNGDHGSIFVAMFRSQRNGKAPHSPKNCMPGGGWVQQNSAVMRITVPGESTPIESNRYIVSKGDVKALVLYWYQSRQRSVASEYWAKYYVIKDAIRYNRTDTSLIRVITMFTGDHEQQAQDAAVDLVRASYPTLLTYLPH